MDYEELHKPDYRDKDDTESDKDKKSEETLEKQIWDNFINRFKIEQPDYKEDNYI